MKYEHEWSERPEGCNDCCRVANLYVDDLRISGSVLEEEPGLWLWRVDVARKTIFGAQTLGNMQSVTLFAEEEAIQRAESSMRLLLQVGKYGLGGAEGSYE